MRPLKRIPQKRKGNIPPKLLEVYCPFLPSDPEFLDDDSVSFDVFLLQIVEQSSSLTDNLQQTSAAVMIFFMDLEMFRQIGDPFGEDGYLHFRRSRIIVVQFERADYRLLFFRCQHFSHLLSLKFYSRMLPLSKIECKNVFYHKDLCM
jgi:hypothetical protein